MRCGRLRGRTTAPRTGSRRERRADVRTVIEDTRYRESSRMDEDLLAWHDYIETAELLRSVVALRMQHEASISGADYAVLVALAEAPGNRQRPSHLAEVVRWERSRLSHQLSRMETRGLIVREDLATDARGSEVVLTPRGAERLRAATAPRLEAVREVFTDVLTPEQLDSALLIAARLRAHLVTGPRVSVDRRCAADTRPLHPSTRTGRTGLPADPCGEDRAT
jgi:DNA-binding MarR family transcriptional regulator